MSAAPPGTDHPEVTLVFTDVEGSTQLWEDLGTDFQPLLDLHDAVMRGALDAHGGYEVKTEGDAFMIAFSDAPSAVAFCEAVQAWLGKLDFGGHRIRVRMGAHIGEPLCRPDPNTGRMDYYGPMVNRAARISGAGHGGQIVISEAVRTRLDAPAAHVDLGVHSLRGVEERFQLWQVGPGEFPPLRTARVRRDTLPAEPNPFFGRQQELEAIEGALGDHGVLTVVGPGGVGKSRLVLHAGHLLAPRKQGVAWVDLSGATTSGGMLQAVCSTLGVSASGAAVQRVGRILSGRGDTVLILDAADGVAQPLAEAVGSWLSAAPKLSILATAHAPMALPQETLLALGPLTTEDARALFLDRAKGPITPADLEQVDQIVAKLDRFPLALELAAARTALVSPGQLLSHLDNRFRVLRGRGNHTLQAALDGTWESLEPHERAMWAQVSVFEGGFTAEAASVVVDLGPWPQAPWWLDVIQTLTDRGLLRVLDDQHRRLGALATLQAYGLNRLGSPGAVLAPDGSSWSGPERMRQVRLAHARWAADFGTPTAINALNGLNGPTRWFQTRRELVNLQAAARWALTADEAELAQNATTACWNVLFRIGPFSDGVALMEDVDRTFAGRIHPYFIRSLARGWAYMGQFEEAIQRSIEGAEHADRIGDDITAAHLWQEVGNSLRESGDMSASKPWYEGAHTRYMDAGFPLGAAMAEFSLGILLYNQGHTEQAAERYALAIAHARPHGAHRTVAAMHGNFGNLRADQGKGDEARSLYREAARLFEIAGDTARMGAVLSNAGRLEHDEDRLEEAEALYERGLEIHREIGDEGFAGLTLTNLAEIDSDRGDLVRATTRITEARTLLQRADWGRELAVQQSVHGDILRKMGRFDEARALLAHSLSTMREGGPTFMLGRVLLRCANLEHDCGHRDQAIALVDEVDALADEIGIVTSGVMRGAIDAMRARVTSD